MTRLLRVFLRLRFRKGVSKWKLVGIQTLVDLCKGKVKIYLLNIFGNLKDSSKRIGNFLGIN